MFGNLLANGNSDLSTYIHNQFDSIKQGLTATVFFKQIIVTGFCWSMLLNSKSRGWNIYQKYKRNMNAYSNDSRDNNKSSKWSHSKCTEIQVWRFLWFSFTSALFLAFQVQDNFAPWMVQVGRTIHCTSKDCQHQQTCHTL